MPKHRFIEYIEGKKFQKKEDGEQVLIAPSNQHMFDNYGKLIEKNEIVVDLDLHLDKPDTEIQRLLDIVQDVLVIMSLTSKTRVVRSKHGFHIHFKMSNKFDKAVTQSNTDLGFHMEYKFNKRGKPADITEKVDGHAYAIINEVENSDDFMEIPKLFFPTKSELDFGTFFDPSNGRNELMFHVMAFIKNSGLVQKGNLTAIAMKLNELFESPLDYEELVRLVESASETDANEKRDYTNKNGGLDLNILIEDINECSAIEHHLGNHWIYNKQQGVWCPLTTKGDNNLGTSALSHDIRELTGVTPLSKQLIEIVKTVEASHASDLSSKQKELHYPVMTKHGLLSCIPSNGKRKGIIKYSERNEDRTIPTDFSPFYFPFFEYQDEEPAHVQVIDDILNHVSNDNKDNLKHILESISLIFLPDEQFRGYNNRFCIFYGTGSNGKSTLLNVIKDITGDFNYSMIRASQLADNGHISTLYNKRAILSEEITDRSITQQLAQTIKTLVTGEGNTMRGLFESGRSIKGVYTIFATANEPVNFWDLTEGWTRRISQITMNRKVVKTDPNIMYKLQQEDALKYFNWLISEAMRNMYAEGHIKQTTEYTQSTLDLIEKNNYPVQFIKDISETPETLMKHIDGVSLNSLFNDYKEWCQNESIKFQKLTEFQHGVDKYLNDNNLGTIISSDSSLLGNEELLSKQIKYVISEQSLQHSIETLTKWKEINRSKLVEGWYNVEARDNLKQFIHSQNIENYANYIKSTNPNKTFHNAYQIEQLELARNTQAQNTLYGTTTRIDGKVVKIIKLA